MQGVRHQRTDPLRRLPRVGASLPDSGRRASVCSRRVDLSDHPAARQQRRALAAARREYPARLPRKFGPSGAVARHLGPPALHTLARVASWGEPRFSHGRGAGCWCHGRPSASAPCQRAQGRSRPATTAGASRHQATARAGRSACQLPTAAGLISGHRGPGPRRTLHGLSSALAVRTGPPPPPRGGRVPSG
jgi:hypothetical protein